MATIVATVTSGLHPTASKTYTLTDADLDRIVAAYQPQGAALPYAQVLQGIFDQVLIASLRARVAGKETVAGVPPVIT